MKRTVFFKPLVLIIFWFMLFKVLCVHYLRNSCYRAPHKLVVFFWLCMPRRYAAQTLKCFTRARERGWDLSFREEMFPEGAMTACHQCGLSVLKGLADPRELWQGSLSLRGKL